MKFAEIDVFGLEIQVDIYLRMNDKKAFKTTNWSVILFRFFMKF